MSRRTNPWPAFVDLFSALLVAAFAGFVLIASELKGAAKHNSDLGAQLKDCNDQLDKYGAEKGELTRLRAEADRIVQELDKTLTEDQLLKSKVVKCGDDSCLDLFIHYPRNKAQIPPDQQQQVIALQEGCHTLRAALDRLPTEKRHDIEILVEGHADRTQVRGTTIDPQVAYLFNWSLSSQRAASVLYLFQECGLNPPNYSVSMIGYADSEKVCDEPTEECDQKNRRTTLRLRANTQKIARRLEK